MVRPDRPGGTATIAPLDVRHKCWVERDGDLVLSDWRIALLAMADELGSLRAAAEACSVSYRVAWGKLHDIETRLGIKLLDGRSGGANGGGSSLTPAGRDVVERYRRFRSGLDELVERRFNEAFAGSPLLRERDAVEVRTIQPERSEGCERGGRVSRR